MQVFVTGVDVYAYHGVPDAEREVGHRYRADLTLDVDENASASDQIDGTVDYAAVAAFVADEIRNTQFRTIERLAKVVGEGILTRFARVKEVTVQIAKPLPPAPIPVESVSVRLVVKRT